MNNPILLENLRVIPDFPIPGIQFQDIASLFSKPETLNIMRKEVVDLYKDKGITKVVGLESRGFMLGAITAADFNAGFVMARKPGKLPGKVVSYKYDKEYGKDEICMQEGSISEDDVVLIHDDLLATGGSMKAAIELVKTFKPKKIYLNFIIELTIEGLHGRDVLEGYDITTLMVV